MAIQGVEKHQEIQRSRILRDTRPLFEQVSEILAGLPAIIIVYVILVYCLIFFSGAFDLILVFALCYMFWPLSRRQNIPFRKRKSLHELDMGDRHPGNGKAQMSRGIAFFGNRLSDGMEIWAANEDLRTHVFMIGSTGAGKTEGLISLSYNALVWCSGFSYVDGKGDVSLWAKMFSMAKFMGREDDLLVINYMTGNADTTKKRSDKLSNSYNPFAVGNAESNIQLVVSLMDSGGSGGDMWKGRAISFISSVLPALVDLRDAGLLMLHIGAIREALPFPKYFELMNNPHISQKSRDMMQAFLYDVPGYKRDKGDNQSGTFLEQYGYQQMQFTRILSSLADTYGHIYYTPQGEVNLKDVVTNRRILLVLLPALEKSRPELANLGKIIVAGMKGMMGGQLGGKLEGSKLELLDARATNAPTPFVSIFDEFGYFIPEDSALMWAQARSLGFALVAAGQDLQAFYRTSKEETLAIVSNSNIKIYGKLEDPTDTFDLIEKLAGEAYVSVVDGFEQDMQGIGGFRSNKGARIERVKRIELQDLKNQIEGEIHFLVKSDIIRGRVFYADFSGKQLTSDYRLNHFVRVLPWDQDALEGLKIDTKALIQSLKDNPFAKRRPDDGYFSYVRHVVVHPKYQHFIKTRQGVERGICTLLKYDDTAALPPFEADEEIEGSSGGLVNELVKTEEQANLDTQPATGTALLAEERQEDETEDVIFDATLMQLGSVDAFGAKPKASHDVDVMALAFAANSIIETTLGHSLPRNDHETGREAETETENTGLLDREGVALQLNRIALGLGADGKEAAAVSEQIMTAATRGTTYPVPPKPESTGKDEDMDDVMSSLESLIGVG